MRKNLTRVLLVMFSLSFLTAQGMPSNVQTYLNTLFDVLSSHYLNTKNVDWKSLKATAETSAKDAQTTQDLVPVVHQVFETIADREIVFEDAEVIAARTKRSALGYSGFFLNIDLVVTELVPGGPLERAGAQIGDVLEAVDGEPPVFAIDGPLQIREKRTTLSFQRNGQILDFTIDREAMSFDRAIRSGRLGRVGYIEPPVNTDGNDGQNATSIQVALRSLESSGACGWLIDARRDRSNVTGLWAGLGPLLGENLVSFQTNTQTIPWKYNSSTGSLLRDVVSVVTVSTRAFVSKHPDAPVVVLIEPYTDSFLSGAFLGRANTILLGRANPYPVLEYGSYDLEPSRQSNISFPIARVLDRNGKVIDRIKSDVTLETNWQDFGTKRDRGIQAALEWLQSQPACK